MEYGRERNRSFRDTINDISMISRRPVGFPRSTYFIQTLGLNFCHGLIRCFQGYLTFLNLVLVSSEE